MGYDASRIRAGPRSLGGLNVAPALTGLPEDRSPDGLFRREGARRPRWAPPVRQQRQRRVPCGPGGPLGGSAHLRGRTFRAAGLGLLGRTS